MDGNGRWARSKGFRRITGHSKGSIAVRNIVTHCRKLGVKFLTLYAFSEENWKRPRHEISILMRLLKRFLISERTLLMENDVCLETIGDIDKLPPDVRKTLEDTKTLTKNNQTLKLILALSYGGREELIRAFKKIGQNLLDGEIDLQNIDDTTISNALDTQNIPDPDLIIRTSGEFRTSNFLPWQSIYAEWYITSVFWPDFTPSEFDRALQNYGTRERRFGMTGDQIKKKTGGAF